MNACIYKITNLVNGKIYIGQTINFRKRKASHRKILNNTEYKSYIKNAFKKYGKENFKFDIIVQGNFNKELLNELETHYIHLYNSTNHKVGYNLTKGGQHSSNKNLKETYVYNLSGEYITSYKSASETARNLNLNPDAVNQCCRKENAKVGDYRFSYVKLDKLSPKINKRNGLIKIKLLSTGEIKEYETHKECSKDLGFGKITIYNAKRKFKEGSRKNLILKKKFEIIL